MKKGVTLLLVCSMMLSLVACGQKGEVTPKPITPVKKVETTLEKHKENIGEIENISNYKDMVIEYSEDDVISQKLKELSLDIEKTGYSLYPTKEYFYSLDLLIGGKLNTVYLPLNAVTEEFKIDNAIINDVYLNSLPIRAEIASTSSKGNIFDSITNSIGNMVGSTASGVVPSESISESEDVGVFYEPIYDEDFNTSEYENVNESNYLSVKTSPLSTFAADVDTASYTNIRNIVRTNILSEFMIDMDSLHDIRIEEMLNYFDYSYNDGLGENPFNISAEIAPTPWNKDTQLLVVNVKAQEYMGENEGSNIVFLVDTSGSMDMPNKLPLLKQGIKLLINKLTEKDTVSIVTYSGDSAVLADGLTGADKEELLEIIDKLSAYGSTNGEGGMKAAYKIAEKYKDTHSNSRIIMCSDGDLNVGISSQDELHDFVSEKRETGIYLSVLGFGSGNYKDNKMETLADNGNGNYYYIDSIKEAQKVLIEDMMSTLITIGDDVKFQIEFNPEFIKGYRKIGYENRNMANEDFADDTKDGGEVGYGHEVTVVYEIVPVNSELELSETDLKYQETVSSGSSDWLTVKVRYKDHGESESKLIEYVVDGNHYTETPSDDWKFISNVVGFGLVANNSEYKNDLVIADIINSLNELDLDEDSKREFVSIVMGYAYIISNIKEE